MSDFFNFNESIEDLVRNLKTGAKEFAKVMSEEAKARGYQDGCFGPKDFGFNKDFNFSFNQFSNPRYETYKREDGSLVFEFLLPGFEESGIDLSFKGDAMILKASLPESHRSGPEGRRPFLRDIDRREYAVPADKYDQPAAKAVFRSGVLTVTIPAVEEDTSGQIKVEIVKEGS